MIKFEFEECTESIGTPVQNSIQQRQKFSDEIFIILASITFILIRIIEFEIKTKGNFEKMQFSHFKCYKIA